MITARTKLFAVVGDPIAHSLSPILHNGWIADAGLDAVYAALPVKDGGALKSLASLGFGGVNVTAPHKEAAFAAADDVCETAQVLGAANVLTVTPDRRLSARNTDVAGLTASLDERWPDWRLTTRVALVIGAGGAGRAAALAIVTAGIPVRLANRTEARAHEAARRIAGIDVHPYTELQSAFASADLVINSVSADLDHSAHFAAAGPSTRVVDLRYGAMNPRFLREAHSAGLATMDGLGMLLHQGALAFTHWFDVAPSIEAGRRRLIDAMT